jgi:hypothetical protein
VVQIVWSSRKGSRPIEHLGSTDDDAQLEALKAAAAQRLALGQHGVWRHVRGPFKQFAFAEDRARSDEGDEFGCVDFGPARLGGLDELVGHGDSGGV